MPLNRLSAPRASLSPLPVGRASRSSPHARLHFPSARHLPSPCLRRLKNGPLARLHFPSRPSAPAPEHTALHVPLRLPSFPSPSSLGPLRKRPASARASRDGEGADLVGPTGETAGADISSPSKAASDRALDLGHPELPYAWLTGLASIGAMETAYLTYEKLFGGPLTCPFGGGCNDVLDSSYGTLLGIPLPLYGFLSYSSVALLTQISKFTAQRGLLKDNLRWFLLALTSTMAGTSAFLMYILKFELDSAFCAYCIFSAALSGLLLALTFQGFSAAEIRKALAPQAALVCATVFGLSVAFTDASEQEIDLPPVEPEVTTLSTPLEVRLAKHLSAVGAKMYGAFWCSHCYEQKQAFGQEAAKQLPYVECYPEGYRRGVKLAKACVDAKIEGFPTWVINGELYPGEQEPSELARLTGF